MLNKEKLKFDLSAYESSLVALAQAIEIGIINSVNTCEVVKVLSVNAENNTLTAIPLVKNLTTEDVACEESPIYNLKYFGWQYGKCAIQGTPKQDDVGFVVISKRDISNINSGVVGSKRKFSMADGIYIGGLVGFNATPTEYISLSDDGITIKSTKDVNVEAKNVNVKAETKATVKSETVDIIGTTAVNLGNIGGQPVARVGDSVVVNLSTGGGTITSGSAIVKSI